MLYNIMACFELNQRFGNPLLGQSLSVKTDID